MEFCGMFLLSENLEYVLFIVIIIKLVDYMYIKEILV